MEQVVRLSDAAQGELSLDEQLGHVLDTAREAVAVDRLHLWAIAPEGDTLLYVRGSGLSERDRRSLSERPQVRLADAAAMASALRDRSTFLVNDGAAGPPRRNAAVKVVGAKSFFVLPVIARDRPLGLLVADNDYGGSPLIPEALGLLSTFALHLATAVDNALLRDELRARDQALTESLEQQTATSEVLRVISRSPIDLQPVLDAVAERVAQLCGHGDGAVSLVEGDHFVIAAKSVRIPSPLGEHRPIRRDSVLGRALLDNAVIHIPNLQEACEDELSEAVARARRYGYRAVLAVPMVHEGRPIGVLWVSRNEATPFSGKQIELVRTFADQAVIAIENTRLFKELQERLEQQTATSEILRIISQSQRDVQPVFQAIASNARKLCDATFAVVFRFDGELINVAAADSASSGYLERLHRMFPMRPSSRSTLAARAILARAMIYVPDVREDPEFPVHLAQTEGFLSALAIPMLRNGTPIGSINVAGAEPGMFSERQIAMLQTFADQAVIAIENTRLFNESESRNRELSEALEQQTATSEILRVISQSQRDAQPVFEVIATSALKLCDGTFGGVYTYDGHLLRLAAADGFGPDGIEVLRQSFPRVPGRARATDRAVLTREVVYIPDVREDPEYELHGLGEAAGFRSVLCVPMLREGRPIGAIGVARTEPAMFSERQIALLKTFADQAVIAIENTRLFNELESRNRDLTEALEQQTATSEILQVISQSQRDVQPVFETIAASALRLCDGRFAGVWTYDGELVHLAALVGFTEDEVDAVRQAFPSPPGRGGFANRAILTRAAVHVPDLREDSEYLNRTIADTVGYRSVLFVPMLREGRPIGTVGVSRAEPGLFSERQVAMLQTFADQAVIAIENTRLFNELESRNRDLTESLEQQTATSEILRVISQSQRDVERAFAAIARNARKLSGAGWAVCYTFDGELIRYAASDSMHPQVIEAIQRLFPMAPNRGSALGRAILGRTFAYIPDVQEDSEYRLGALAQTAGYRCTACVPMLRGGIPIGAISLSGAEPAMFTDRQITMLQTFADQAVIAIENARLFNELQTRTAELGRSVDELKALGEVSSAVSSTLDLDTVLTTIVTHANQLAGTQAGLIYDYDEATEELLPRAPIGIAEEIVEGLRRNPLRKGEGVSGQAMMQRQPVQVPDIAVGGAYQSRVRNLMLESGFRAVLAVPLIREDQVMGALVVSRAQPGEFSPQVIELLTTFASQSALAMQNARLFHQLEAASQHKSAFLANMSHELRTPLNAIIGYSEMLQEDAVDAGAESLVPDLRRVNAAGKHLLELINSILDLSKIEAGRMELQLEDFGVADMVNDIRAVIQPLAEKNGNRLEVDCEPATGNMHADLTKVRQVLFNLLSNACKFTENGLVALKVEREGARDDAWLTFTVSDTGIGLTADQLGRLFQEFSQADATTTRKYGGTGLGLALSRRLARLMGGDITAVSQAGQGSSFTVRLPANVTHLAERPESAQTGSAGTVLVIDDELPVRDLMRRFLNKEGFRVLAVGGGEDGLRIAREQRPDAITLDVMMPGMDGWTVLSALMADPDLRDIPVIMLTIVDDKHTGYALGASDYLSKPIDRARLLSVLARYRRDLPILVVDDDPGVRQLLRRTLEAEGYAVTEAENGQTALALLYSGLPGVILLDLMMPVLDGFGVVSALREREAWHGIPVVIITAKELTPEERAWLNGSVVRILEKRALGQDALLSEVRELVAASIDAHRRSGA